MKALCKIVNIVNPINYEVVFPFNPEIADEYPDAITGSWSMSRIHEDEDFTVDPPQVYQSLKVRLDNIDFTDNNKQKGCSSQFFMTRLNNENHGMFLCDIIKITNKDKIVIGMYTCVGQKSVADMLIQAFPSKYAPTSPKYTPKKRIRKRSNPVPPRDVSWRSNNLKISR